MFTKIIALKLNEDCCLCHHHHSLLVMHFYIWLIKHFPHTIKQPQATCVKILLWTVLISYTHNWNKVIPWDYTSDSITKWKSLLILSSDYRFIWFLCRKHLIDNKTFYSSVYWEIGHSIAWKQYNIQRLRSRVFGVNNRLTVVVLYPISNGTHNHSATRTKF